MEASICLSLFYLIYWSLIRDDTFHKLKRYYLLMSVFISLIIPVLPATNWTKDIEKSILPPKLENVHNSFSQNIFEKLALGGITNQPVIEKEVKKPITFLSALFILYVLGTCFMLFRLINNLNQILYLVKRNKRESYGKYTIISLTDDYPTFSFFRYIFFNDKNLSANDKNDVLLHEEIHIEQGHSFDILLIEICKILFWFIPVIWHYKISLSKVHECLADEFLVELKSDKILDYQSLLLKQYLSNFKIELAHPFNYSLIKFRINMMTKTKSKWWAKYKLVFALPIIILSLVAFTNDRLISTTKATLLIDKSQGLTEPNGWHLSGSRPDMCKTGVDNQISQHGQKSATIESIRENPTGFSTLMQRCNVKEFKGKRIKMTGYIKSQGLSDTASMWIRVDDIDKKMVLDFDNMMDRPVVGTKDWTKCEIIFDVPDRSVVFYGFIFKGVGKIWMDNVSFEVVESSTAKTTQTLNEPFPDQYLEQLKQYPLGKELPEIIPVNLDFEE